MEKPKLTKEQKAQIKKQKEQEKKRMEHLKNAEEFEAKMYEEARGKLNYGEYGLVAQYIMRRVEEVKNKAQDKKL